MFPPQRKSKIGDAFRQSAAKTLAHYPLPILQELLEHYQLSESSDQEDDANMMSILRFANDICFFAPPIELAAHFSRNAYVFCFNEPNPWPGPFQGHATHILDVAFLFQNYSALLDEKQRAGAVQLGADVITFVCGKEPWTAFNDSEHGVAVYAKGERTFSGPPEEERTKRHPFVFTSTKKEGWPSLDELMKVFMDFLAG